MNVGIIGGNLEDYSILNKKLNELIEIQGTYLFNIICGYGSLGEKWADRNGAGKRYFTGSFDDFIKQLDYAIVFQNKGVTFNPVLVKLKAAGKHGTVIVRG